MHSFFTVAEKLSAHALSSAGVSGILTGSRLKSIRNWQKLYDCCLSIVGYYLSQGGKVMNQRKKKSILMGIALFVVMAVVVAVLPSNTAMADTVIVSGRFEDQPASEGGMAGALGTLLAMEG